MLRPSADRFRSAYSPTPLLSRVGGAGLTFIRRHVRTYQWLKALFFDRPRTYFEHDVRLYDGPSVDAAVEDLRRLKTLAAAHSIHLEVVLLPYEYQLRAAADPEVFRPQRLLRERIAAAGLPVYDPAPYLLAAGAEPADLYLYGDGIHFSEEGHRLIAEWFAETVR